MRRRLGGALLALVLAVPLIAGVAEARPVSASAGPVTVMPFDLPGYAAVTGGDISCPEVGDCVRLADVDSEGSATVAVARSSSGVGLATTVLPRPAGVGAGAEVHYTALSCPTTSWCLAIGVAESPRFAGRPIFARLSRGVWAARLVPAPTAQPGTVAHDVSCWAVGQCVTVGSAVTFAGNGGAWSGRFDDGEWVGGLEGAALRMGAVSCVTDGWCVAVGNAGDDPVSYEGEPGTWTERPMPVPSGAAQALYAAVSCAPSHICAAVGSAEITAGGGTQLIATLGASGWTDDELPDHASGAYIDVSCPSIGACVIVGDGDATGSLIAVRQTASGWQESALPLLPGWTEADLRHVDCPTAGECTASGFQGVDPGTAIRETLAASAWAAGAVPVVLPPRGPATGLDCAGARECRSIGVWYDTAGALRGFSDVRTVAGWAYPAMQPQFHGFVAATGGIACPSLYWCVASAVIEAGGEHESPVVATLAHGSWTTRRLPMSAVSSPGSVSVSTPVCSAVGSCRVLVNARGATATAVAADTLAGGEWTRVAVPVPTGTVIDELTALSCATATDCTAFGRRADGRRMVAATLASGVWTSRDVAAVPVDRVASMSCPTAAYCVAVAYGADNPASHHGPLVWTLASGEWTAVRLALGADTSNAVFRGVSCPVVGHCVAVGFRDYVRRNTSDPLVGALSDGGWARYRPAVPPDVLAASLTSVDCPTRSVVGVCRAVGDARGADGGLRPASVPISVGG